jgi:hypothetical protein
MGERASPLIFAIFDNIEIFGMSDRVFEKNQSIKET